MSKTLIGYVSYDGSKEELLNAGWEYLQTYKPTVVFCNTSWEIPGPDIYMMVSDGSIHKMTLTEFSDKVKEIESLQWYSTEIVPKVQDWEYKYDSELLELKQLLDKIKIEKKPYWFGTVAYTTSSDSILTTTRGKRGDGFCEIIRVEHRTRKIFATDKATLNAPFLEMLSYEFGDDGRVIIHAHKELPNCPTFPYIFDGTRQYFTIIDEIRLKKINTFNIRNHGFYKIFSSFKEANTWVDSSYQNDETQETKS